MLFKADHDVSLGDQEQLLKMKSLRLVIDDLIKSQFDAMGIFAQTVMLNEGAAVIFESMAPEKLKVTLRGILHEFEQITGETITVAVGLGGQTIGTLWKDYSRCQSVLEAKMFFAKNSILFFEEMMIDPKQTESYPFKQEADIINCLSTGNLEALEEKVERFYQAACGVRRPSKENLLRISIILIGNVFRLCMEEETENQEIFLKQVNSFDQIRHCENMQKLKQTVLESLQTVFDQLGKTKSVSKLIGATIAYISEHFSQNIKLEDIAKKIYITPCYLSNLFKRETGVNFVDYLHKYRIGKAKEYIADCRYRFYEIANLVGYQDEKYFSHIFKKHTGMTPKQYRDSIPATALLQNRIN